MLSALTLPHVANASTIVFVAYQSEMNSNSGNNFLAFYNLPTSQADISRITVYLGQNAVFDTVGHGSDGLARTLASTSSSNTISVTHFSAAWTANATAAQVGLTAALSSMVPDLGHTATFSFSNFTPGTAWGVFVDLDTANNARAQPGGSDFNGLQVQVSFEGIADTLTSSCSDPNYTPGMDECHSSTFGGTGKRSFPSANSAYFVAYEEVPEPGTFLLIGAGLIGCASLSRRKRA
jgi:hypothetical protein